ncbi:histidine kinase [Mangrovactinospora gilvigrisea]|uniref:Histidine kinase n=1 Tax=Mangrovactinospora gilvigrisea TaxID=1428644 RepID=A0A1J7C9T9_9ACTN|nr:GAF domain-containing protein [Mangrovactinospora gilvigrisea]OIV38284.1 histidine kinase [Mangrovactinospora gilvigrisea]
MKDYDVPDFDLTGHQLLRPNDTGAEARAARLRELGFGEQPDPAFDDFAAQLASITKAPYAMVNFIDDRRQFFAGLYTPEGSSGSSGPADGSGAGPAPLPTGRTMRLDQGFCPHVIVRKKALVLDDVCDYPRFAGNPVVDELGIRSYLGAPLLDDRTGQAIGTVCVVDQEPRPWGRQGLATIKEMAAAMKEQLDARLAL